MSASYTCTHTYHVMLSILIHSLLEMQVLNQPRIAGPNLYLYVVNQESTDLIREAHMGDVSFSLNGNGLSQDLFYFQSLSLD